MDATCPMSLNEMLCSGGLDIMFSVKKCTQPTIFQMECIHPVFHVIIYNLVCYN